MVYKAKIDAWFHLLVGLLIAVPTGLVYLAATGRHPVLFIIGAFFAIFDVWVVLPVWMDTRYVLEEKGLFIHSGRLVNRRIPYGSILQVQPTRDPGTAPAPSLQRLRITFRTKTGTGHILISPKDPAGFTAQLAKRQSQSAETGAQNGR